MKASLKTVLILSLLVLIPNASIAQDSCGTMNKCVNTYEPLAQSGKKIVDVFCEAQARVPALFKGSAPTHVRVEAAAACATGLCSPVNKATEALKAITNRLMIFGKVVNEPKTDKEQQPVTASSKSTSGAISIDYSCIAASLKRETGSGYLCRSENSNPEKVPANSCISEQIAQHYQEVINDGINCLNAEGGGIDPKVILQKMNNESGFNPQLSSPAGLGIGQLVPISIREMVGKKPGEGNGRKVVQRVADSSSPFCGRFKSLANKDLQVTPPLPSMTAKQNLCPYISFDGGFARNAILSLALYVHYRDMILSELKAKNIPEASIGANISKLTLAAYSRHGPGGVRSFLRAQPNGRPLSTDAIKRRFVYIGEVERKMGELMCIKNFGSDCQSASFRNSKKWSAEDLSGQSCIK